MNKLLTRHISSILLLLLIVVSAVIVINGRNKTQQDLIDAKINKIVPEKVANLTDPFQAALLLDLLDLYYPQEKNNNELAEWAVRQKNGGLPSNQEIHDGNIGLEPRKIFGILLTYSRFLAVFALVLLFSYYAVHSFGLYLFVKRERAAYKHGTQKQNVILKFINVPVLLILFSPSYTIAYAIKTEIPTDTFLFLVILTALANGFVISYTNKFYNLLITESRKGFVETAATCKLSTDWSKKAIPWQPIFKLNKSFDGHILHPIYNNARIQYYSTLKEQSVYLVTGLIITEMALNIHGYFSYEMLRCMLYKRFDLTIIHFFLIFLTVKLCEIGVDLLIHNKETLYAND